LDTQNRSETRLSRRQALRLVLGGAAAVAAGTVVAGSASADATGFLRTTSALNLRTGPGLRRRIILVIPENAMVTDLGGAKYGFRQVSYQGTDGWASADYLIDTNGGSTDSPVVTGAAITSTAVNLRSGPSTSNQVLRVVAANAMVQTTSTVQNKFRYVVFEGQAGWMYEDYLLWTVDGPVPEFLTVTSALNLRAEPNTSSAVKAVMPEGSQVRPTGAGSNNFSEVFYGNLKGWAYTAYLN
jgi:uncharacterized protein YraI